ncbi:MAG TPA: hypothetical protein QF901_05645 [Gammaproteobacteria bacterium]|jgi:hypothetical protein|nr:hypothetical protein [Candidatus Hydrogenedentota bacterium]HJP35455.1 hypothetical protein [Gammaproteobacteria bacterium]
MKNTIVTLAAFQILALLALGPVAFGETKGSEEMAPLPIVLPEAMFSGTPKDIRTSNLERQTGRKRPPFLAPVGAVNVALEKEVTGSDEEPIIGEIEQVTDGDKSGADGSFVEFGPGSQYVQIDLEEVCEIYAVVFWHFHAQARVYFDVIIRTADDPDFITNVQTIFNSDHDNSSGLGIGKDKEFIETDDGKLVDAKGVKTQYVRLYSNGSTASDMNHYNEVEIYGKPVAE